jgi:hypothetical protein
LHSLNQGLHPAYDPIDGGELHKFARSSFSLPQSVAKRFDGDVLADMATMLEAVGDRLCHAINRHYDSVDLNVLDPPRQGFTSSTNEFHRQACRTRRSGLVGNGHPNGERKLSGQLVLTKGADQADNSVRDKTRRFRQIVCYVLTDALRFLVETATEADKIAGVVRRFR